MLNSKWNSFKCIPKVLSVLQVPNFNINIVKLLLDFLARAFFQHYNLYLYVYTRDRLQDIVNVEFEVETARIPPLSAGVLQVEKEDEPESSGENVEDGSQQEEEDGTEGEEV